LTEWTEGIEDMYEIGEEIEIYKNEKELEEKILFLKKDDNKRKNLRTKGQQRALSEHSVPKSIQKILAAI
jgi:spore maturation protein CgeB